MGKFKNHIFKMFDLYCSGDKMVSLMLSGSYTLITFTQLSIKKIKQTIQMKENAEVFLVTFIQMKAETLTPNTI